MLARLGWIRVACVGWYSTCRYRYSLSNESIKQIYLLPRYPNLCRPFPTLPHADGTTLPLPPLQLASSVSRRAGGRASTTACVRHRRRCPGHIFSANLSSLRPSNRRGGVATFFARIRGDVKCKWYLIYCFPMKIWHLVLKGQIIIRAKRSYLGHLPACIATGLGCSALPPPSPSLVVDVIHPCIHPSRERAGQAEGRTNDGGVSLALVALRWSTLPPLPLSEIVLRSLMPRMLPSAVTTAHRLWGHLRMVIYHFAVYDKVNFVPKFSWRWMSFILLSSMRGFFASNMHTPYCAWGSSLQDSKKIERLAGGVHCLRDIVLIVISVLVISTHLASGDDVDTVLISFVQETEIRILFKFKEEYLFSVLIISQIFRLFSVFCCWLPNRVWVNAATVPRIGTWKVVLWFVKHNMGFKAQNHYNSTKKRIQYIYFHRVYFDQWVWFQIILDCVHCIFVARSATREENVRGFFHRENCIL